MNDASQTTTPTPTSNDQLLHQELDKVSLRYRRLLLWVGLGACWLVLAAGAAAMLTWARLTERAVPGLVLVLMFVLPLVLVPTLLSALRAVRNPFWIARRLERRFMDLDERLLAAMEQAPDDSTRQLGFLQQTVIGEAVQHAQTHRWESLVSGWKIRAAQLAQFVTLCLFVLIAASIVADMRRRPSESSWWMGGIADRGDAFDVKVEPEDTSIERGTSLLVLARFPKRLPPDVQLLYRDADGKEQHVPMSKSLDDPVFAGRVSSVNNDMTYAIRYGDNETKWYKVSVFDYPNLEQADVRLKFPEYTGAPEKLVEDTRSVTAVEGTNATLSFRLNKPVTDARLVPERPRTAQEATTTDAAPVQLAVDPKDPTLYSVSLDMKQSQRFRLHLTDADKRSNKDKPDLVLNVTPNRAPDVKLAFPGRDVDVSPLQEMNVRAQVWDDFGIKRVGLSYAIAGQESKDVVLAEGIGAKEKRDLTHMVSLEQLDAEPDQLLSYHLWVEDVAPDGNVRRTAGDMFFAEVRPFEEIYRQGQQPAGGEEQQQQQQQQGSQNAQQAEELAEQQKQIILATWKVMTRETSATPTQQFVPDVKLIGESQAAAREQAGGMEERLRDERSKGFLKNVLKFMEDAEGHLKEAAEGPAIKSLAPALASEQAAYAELLKLRAREHEVVRSNRQQRGQQQRSGSQQQRQQQLDQLDLNNEENRYETERQANPQQETAEQRETRQVLNRLRELAQRQEDLNRQMKELQMALEEARDQAQREELKRQLQRLRDQQQQNLRDTDELRDRMDSPENQQRMSDARQQLEESRENVRRASEALEQGMVPEAQSAGARASEQLNNLRDEFRKRTAGQFNDAMDRMRQDARELDQKQQDLSKQMAEAEGATGREQREQNENGNRERRPAGLRDRTDRNQVAQDLQQQKERLEKLMEEMKRTVEEAETAEPLLSKQLYETAREVKQQQPEKALDLTRQMLERGFVEEARRQETDAGKAITRLREGVEEAAESVLGDEAEALRRARNELDALSQELEREMRRRTGGASDQGDPTTRPVAGGAQVAQNDAQQQSEDGQRQPETPGEGQRRPQQQQRDGQQARNGGSRPGEQQDGQQQSGEEGSQQSESAQANGQSPSEQEGQQQGGQQQGGQQQGGQRQQQASSRQQGQQPGGGQGQGNEQQQGEEQQQADAQQGADRQGERPGSQQSRDGQQQQQSRQARGGGGGGLRQGGADERTRGGPEDLQRLLEPGRTGGGGNEEFVGPLTGGNFRDWSDRLRDVEEMVSDPRLRAEAARIRERAREIRAEFNRHSKEPNWDIVRDFVSRPLVELRDKVAEELLRKQGSEALVPIDREPVPPEYTEQVRRYYERLGSGTR